MKLSLCPQPLYSLGLAGALDAAVELGVDAIELPVDAGSPLVDLDALLADGGAGARRLRAELDARGLALSALSNHQEGQLLLGPHHADTDRIHAGTPAEKAAFAAERLVRTAELASALSVDVVVGFVGCEDELRRFPWPDPDGWERMRPVFQERVGALLDRFDALGVAFAQEPHPKQFVYNTETALESVALLDGHPRWRFNLDPANLLLAGVDPCLFAQELGDRVAHVHAKDGRVERHNEARSGPLAHGAWDRPGRGFRFAIAGWGDVPWRRLISALRLAGYDGYLAVEHEDPVFGPREGLAKAIAELAPLVPRAPREERWW